MDEDNCKLFLPHNDIASDRFVLIGCAAFYFTDYKNGNFVIVIYNIYGFAAIVLWLNGQ